MKYVIAVFKSRNDTMSFFNMLRNKNIRCEIINTPKQTLVSCGISVKFEPHNIEIARSLIAKTRNSFLGFYGLENFGIRTIVSPLK